MVWRLKFKVQGSCYLERTLGWAKSLYVGQVGTPVIVISYQAS